MAFFKLLRDNPQLKAEACFLVLCHFCSCTSARSNLLSLLWQWRDAKVTRSEQKRSGFHAKIFLLLQQLQVLTPELQPRWGQSDQIIPVDWF